MMPIVDGLEAEFNDQISIIRFNAAKEENAALQSEYGLFGHPAFAILDGDNHMVQSYFGPQTAETLRQALAGMLQDTN